MNKKGRIALISLGLSSMLLLNACASISDKVQDAFANINTKTKETEVTKSLDNTTDNSESKSEPSSVEISYSDRARNFSVEEAARRDEDNQNGAKPLKIVDIATVAQPAVVAINTHGVRETFYGVLPAEGAGSGVILSEDGYIVTNHHVIRNADEIEVVLATGKKYIAELIGSSPIHDIAVLKIKANDDLPYAIVGNSDDLLVGELAVAVGNPLGDFQGTVTSGIVSSLGRTLVLESNGELVELRNLIQTDAAINSGNSGGGLFNSYGELIGINVAKAGTSAYSSVTVEGLSFAIPMNTVTPLVNAIVNEGYVSGQPILQIIGWDVTERMAQSYEGKVVVGVWVKEVAPKSAVANEGLQPGDIIVEFEGEEVTGVSQLNLIKNRYKAGDEVSLKYFRNGEYFTITFKLDEHKELSKN